MKTATLTASISTDTRIQGRYFADFRINGRQATRVGDEKTVVDFLNSLRIAAEPHGIVINFVDETFGGELSHIS